MKVLIIFLLGVGNFAMHKAVLESGHPLLAKGSFLSKARSGGVTLIPEFLLLVAALLPAWHGWTAAVWIYFVYTGLNAVAAWLVLKQRI